MRWALTLALGLGVLGCYAGRHAARTALAAYERITHETCACAHLERRGPGDAACARDKDVDWNDVRAAAERDHAAYTHDEQEWILIERKYFAGCLAKAEGLVDSVSEY